MITQPVVQEAIQSTNLRLSEAQEQQLLPVGYNPSVTSLDIFYTPPALNLNESVKGSQKELHEDKIPQGNGTDNIPSKLNHADRSTSTIQKFSGLSDIHSSAILKISENQKAWLAWEAKRDKSTL